MTIGQEILFRYNKRCAWKKGRIKNIDPDTSRSARYSIEEFHEKAKVLDWDNLHPSGLPEYKIVSGWFFFCWLSYHNLQSL